MRNQKQQLSQSARMGWVGARTEALDNHDCIIRAACIYNNRSTRGRLRAERDLCHLTMQGNLLACLRQCSRTPQIAVLFRYGNGANSSSAQTEKNTHTPYTLNATPGNHVTSFHFLKQTCFILIFFCICTIGFFYVNTRVIVL